MLVGLRRSLASRARGPLQPGAGIGAGIVYGLAG